jgi:hypothetical protein
MAQLRGLVNPETLEKWTGRVGGLVIRQEEYQL